MNYLENLLKTKREQNQTKTPKYGMRKLSVGFVSCFLGCAIFMAPVGVHAEEATDMPVAAAIQAEAAKPVETTEPSAVEKETVAEEK